MQADAALHSEATGTTHSRKQSPLVFAGLGKQSITALTGSDDTKRFLQNLGFVVGAKIGVVSQMAGNLIVEVKGTRVALSKALAIRIMVA